MVCLAVAPWGSSSVSAARAAVVRDVLLTDFDFKSIRVSKKNENPVVERGKGREHNDV